MKKIKSTEAAELPQQPPLSPLVGELEGGSKNRNQSLTFGTEVLPLGGRYFLWEGDTSSKRKILLLGGRYFLWEGDISSGREILPLGGIYFLWEGDTSSGREILSLGGRYFLWEEDTTSSLSK